MSRKVSLDHEFNIDKYVELLKKAKGGRSQTQFAKDCGLSVAYLCKHFNKKFANVPVPSTIKKIAACAAYDVSYSELLEAAGYDSKKYIQAESSSIKSLMSHTCSLDFEKSAIAIITIALHYSSINWSSAMKDENYNWGISVKDKNISDWFFKFIQEPDMIFLKQSYHSYDRLADYYGRIAMTNHSSFSKVSFVTDSVKVFEELKKFEPYMLCMYVSVILIDTTSFTVVDEYYLNSALTITDELKQVYTLKHNNA